jgi:hypothetical protein
LKKCNLCNFELDINLFIKNKDICKKCSKSESSRKYREKNREILREKSKVYKKNNPEKVKKARYKFFLENPNYMKDWVSKNRERDNQIKRRSDKKRRNENEIYKMTRLVRNSIRSSIKSLNFKKKTKTSIILGCTMEEFIIYIKSTFKEGMTLENYGEWHLDHIKPISMAKTYEEAIELNHYTNFQALWAIENLKKYNKYES